MFCVLGRRCWQSDLLPRVFTSGGSNQCGPAGSSPRLLLLTSCPQGRGHMTSQSPAQPLTWFNFTFTPKLLPIQIVLRVMGNPALLVVLESLRELVSVTVSDSPLNKLSVPDLNAAHITNVSLPHSICYINHQRYGVLQRPSVARRGGSWAVCVYRAETVKQWLFWFWRSD